MLCPKIGEIDDIFEKEEIIKQVHQVNKRSYLFSEAKEKVSRGTRNALPAPPQRNNIIGMRGIGEIFGPPVSEYETPLG